MTATFLQYEQLAEAIGNAVVAGNESYGSQDLGVKAIRVIEALGWDLLPPDEEEAHQ